METEVLIIGAGSAGLSLAHLLGKNKKSVIIVERKKKEEIGKKVCGDVIISEKVKRFCDLTSFQPPHGEELAQEINQAVFVLESGTEFMVPFDGVMINRNQFGQRLTKEVLKNESVTLLSETIALDPIIED